MNLAILGTRLPSVLNQSCKFDKLAAQSSDNSFHSDCSVAVTYTFFAKQYICPRVPMCNNMIGIAVCSIVKGFIYLLATEYILALLRVFGSATRLMLKEAKSS